MDKDLVVVLVGEKFPFSKLSLAALTLRNNYLFFRLLKLFGESYFGNFSSFFGLCRHLTFPHNTYAILHK